MSAQDKTTICNLALTKIGANLIVDAETTKSEEGKKCNLLYDSLRQRLLRKHAWNFAVSRTRLQPIYERGEVRPYGVAANGDIIYLKEDRPHRFPLPADCLRVLKINDDYTDYKVEGRYIVLRGHGEPRLEYIRDVINPLEFDASFTDCLVLWMAAELAYPIANSASLATGLLTEFDKCLDEAKFIDATEGTPDAYTMDDYYYARFWNWV